MHINYGCKINIILIMISATLYTILLQDYQLNYYHAALA